MSVSKLHIYSDFLPLQGLIALAIEVHLRGEGAQGETIKRSLDVDKFAEELEALEKDLEEHFPVALTVDGDVSGTFRLQPGEKDVIVFKIYKTGKIAIMSATGGYDLALVLTESDLSIAGPVLLNEFRALCKGFSVEKNSRVVVDNAFKVVAQNIRNDGVLAGNVQFKFMLPKKGKSILNNNGVIFSRKNILFYSEESKDIEIRNNTKDASIKAAGTITFRRINLLSNYGRILSNNSRSEDNGKNEPKVQRLRIRNLPGGIMQTFEGCAWHTSQIGNYATIISGRNMRIEADSLINNYEKGVIWSSNGRISTYSRMTNNKGIFFAKKKILLNTIEGFELLENGRVISLTEKIQIETILPMEKKNSIHLLNDGKHIIRKNANKGILKERMEAARAILKKNKNLNSDRCLKDLLKSMNYLFENAEKMKAAVKAPPIPKKYLQEEGEGDTPKVKHKKKQI